MSDQTVATVNALTEALRHFRHQNRVAKAPYFVTMAEAADVQLAALLAEKERLKEALRRFLNEGVDDIDPRLNYVVMQVGRDTLEFARALLSVAAATEEQT